ncbi:IclR family transcriptional regulator [Roseomonas sp. SSH11]|uniref:IclR family transcriptional regulator n=1 Tax=Pararoseomonas baculiformis TaxID=2820812 RepID=A0ABS4ADJ2_9PROT|nr:IclR family transcriptional regulator [Pararoseomonas baculiformis]MBP0445084.1 IclR family transcriptional regulator [Pararoseomonas baculiformis]
MARYQLRPLAQSSAPEGGVAAVDRALLLLAAFRQGDGALSLMELTARTGLVKSTALRLLASLQHFGFIQRRPEGYALGSEISRLQAVHAASFNLGDVVLPVLRTLSAQTKESATFYVRQGDQRLCLYRVDSPQPLRDHGRAGDLFPLDRGSGGRVLLAFSGAEGEIYDRIRRDKLIVLVSDRVPDLAGASAPVFEAGGGLAGSVTLIMPATRCQPSHGERVREAAIGLTRQLGGPVSLFDR